MYSTILCSRSGAELASGNALADGVRAERAGGDRRQLQYGASAHQRDPLAAHVLSSLVRSVHIIPLTHCAQYYVVNVLLD